MALDTQHAAGTLLPLATSPCFSFPPPPSPPSPPPPPPPPSPLLAHEEEFHGSDDLSLPISDGTLQSGRKAQQTFFVTALRITADG